jgi:hypothetical protein
VHVKSLGDIATQMIPGARNITTIEDKEEG